MFFAIIFLGILQGLTEFLPVSSSGHLVFFSKLFSVPDSLFVSIILHVATLLSVVIVFRKRVWWLIKNPFSKDTLKLLVATFPTCLIVLVLMPILESSFGGKFLPICFMITAGILLITDIILTNSKKSFAQFENFEGISFLQALAMGTAQGFAVFPGISRAGSTICTGLMSGANKNSVAEFSFLMSVPIILLSLIKEIYEISVQKVDLNVNVFALIISSIFAFLIGVFAIKFMIKLTQKINFRWFAIYLLIISIFSFFIF